MDSRTPSTKTGQSYWGHHLIQARSIIGSLHPAEKVCTPQNMIKGPRQQISQEMQPLFPSLVKLSLPWCIPCAWNVLLSSHPYSSHSLRFISHAASSRKPAQVIQFQEFFLLCHHNVQAAGYWLMPCLKCYVPWDPSLLLHGNPEHGTRWNSSEYS